MSKMLAVVFSGIGYHGDKPLLYYSSRLARKYGYEIKCAEYGPLPSGVKGDAKKMYNAYELALESVSRQFREVDFSSYRRVLFLSKSMGTAVAATIDAKNKIGDSSIVISVSKKFVDEIKTQLIENGVLEEYEKSRKKPILILSRDIDLDHRKTNFPVLRMCSEQLWEITNLLIYSRLKRPSPPIKVYIQESFEAV